VAVDSIELKGLTPFQQPREVHMYQNTILGAERFFGRIFDKCPWGVEGDTTILCYDCHEELLHNPVFLPVKLLTSLNW
jgi:hypothetical protein